MIVVDGFCGGNFTGGVGRVVDFGVVAPVDVFGDGGAFGLGFQVLEDCELLCGVVGTGRLAVDVIELEVGGGQVGIQRRCFFEFLDGFGVAARGAVESADLIVGNRLVGVEFGQLLELG